MTLSAFLVIIVLASCFAALKWRRTSRTLYIMAAILFLAVGCGPIPAWLLSDLQSAYAVQPTITWRKHNVIVLLGAGTERIAQTDAIEPATFAYPRLVETVGLYGECRKTAMNCKILVSGGDAKHTGSPEAKVYRSALLKLGVDDADVLLEANSMNTWQNAQFASAMLPHQDAGLTLLVSSGLHLRRSALYFAHFGIDATLVRADYLNAILSVVPLSYNFAVADFALNEYIGIARYYVYNGLGWNAVRKHPGAA